MADPTEHLRTKHMEVLFLNLAPSRLTHRVDARPGIARVQETCQLVRVFLVSLKCPIGFIEKKCGLNPFNLPHQCRRSRRTAQPRFRNQKVANFEHSRLSGTRRRARDGQVGGVIRSLDGMGVNDVQRERDELRLV